MALGITCFRFAVLLLIFHGGKSDGQWEDLVNQAQERVGRDLLEKTTKGQTSARISRRGASYV